MKKNFKQFFLLIFSVALLSACHSHDDVIYMQNAVNVGAQVAGSDYSSRIKKDDQLNIVVNCENPELAAPFNMQLNQRAFAGGATISSYGTGTPQPFWVDANGEIAYPILGKLKVEGMTRSEVAETIKEFLVSNGHIKDPIVIVTFNNFKISVLGEVNRPGQFNINNDRVSVLDAIALAGDLTIFGERDKVRLIREENGQQTVYSVDLRDPKLFNSPYFYMHQNDVLYVEPNKTKASNREVSSLYSFGVSLASLALTIATFIRSFN